MTNYDADDVEETLQGLRKKGAAIMVEGGGRVVRWKHTLYDWLKVSKVELAVMAELLLRGPQTEGDLRPGRAGWSRLPDLAALQTLLEALDAPRPGRLPLAPGPEAGVVVTHGLYPPEELEKVRQAFAQSAAAGDDEDVPARASTSRRRAGRRGGARRPGSPRSPHSGPRSRTSETPARGARRRAPRTQIRAGSLIA